MALSLGQAAVAVGMSKPTIQRAIKNGRLSASRNEDGSYSIDESELARVYPDQWRNRYVTGTLKQDETPSIPEVLRAEIEGLRQQVALLRDERDDLHRRLDAEAEERRRLTRLLTDQRATVSVPVEKPGGGLASISTALGSANKRGFEPTPEESKAISEHGNSYKRLASYSRRLEEPS